MAPHSVLAALLLVACCVAGPASAAERRCGSAAPIDTIDAVFDAIFACWTPSANARHGDATVRFSLRRDGTLIGSARVLHRNAGDRTPAASAFDRAIHDAMARAIPLPLSEELGHAIAGRIFAMHFKG